MKTSEWLILAAVVGVIIWIASSKQEVPAMTSGQSVALIGGLNFGDNTGYGYGMANVGDHQNISSEDRGVSIIGGAHWR